MKRTSTIRSGFTLIELLVVIAIIALLISILLPSLQAARNQAKTVKCQTQLRTMGQAMSMYVNDNQRYPGGHHQPGNSRGWIYVWHSRIRAEFMSGQLDNFLCPAAPEEFAWVPKYQEGYKPPNWNGDWPQYGYYKDEIPHFGNGTFFCYGYNECGNREFAVPQRGLGMHPDPIENASEDDLAWIELEEIRVVNPGEMILLGDAIADGTDDHALNGRPFAGAKSRWPAERHRRGANMVFCDGHTEWQKRSNWVHVRDDPVDEDGEGDTPYAQRRWNNDNLPHLKPNGDSED